MKINSSENNLTQYLKNFNFDTTNCQKALDDIKNLIKSDKGGFLTSNYGENLKIKETESLLKNIITANEKATDLPITKNNPTDLLIEDLKNIY